jgi:hypothetical protein
MAKLLGVKFRNTGEAAIASYDYTDIAEGTGVVRFYLFSSQTSTAADYHLTSNALYSNDLTIPGAADIDFDLSAFNLPKTIRGTAIAVVGYKLDGTLGPGSAAIIFTVRKWDGTTETDIAAVTSKTITVPDGQTYYGIINVPITIPLTHFKRGEILRLNLVGSNTGSTKLYYGIDPMNRASGSMEMTAASVYIPFRLDL